MKAHQKSLQKYGLVIITGGSSGIGKSFIQTLSRVHPETWIFNLSRTAPVISHEGQHLIHFAVNLQCGAPRREVLARMLEKAAELPATGPVLLINNAGFGAYSAFPEPDAATQNDMIELNIAAPVALTAGLLPLLRERGGAIINVASTAAYQPTPYMATYGASKAFLLHWSLALGEELRGSAVHVLAVCPGPTRTAFHRRAGFDEPIMSAGTGQTADEVVDTTLRALHRGKKAVVSGGLNRLVVAAVSWVTKPMAAYLAGKVVGRFRLRR